MVIGRICILKEHYVQQATDLVRVSCVYLIKFKIICITLLTIKSLQSSFTGD